MRIRKYKEAISEAMVEAMTKDDQIFVTGHAVAYPSGIFGSTAEVAERFPDRVFDCPSMENAFAGIAVGAAAMGKRPVYVYPRADFMFLSFDNLLNLACKWRYMFGGKAKVPMVLRAPAGSGTGAAGQHSSSMEAWYTHVPGLKVVIPSTPADAKGLLASAIQDDNPVVFLEQKLLYRQKGEVAEDRYFIPLSQSDVKRSGTDLTIVTWGRMVPRCIEVAEQLAREVSIEVIDPRTLMPLDTAPIIDSVRKTGRLLIVHEAVQTGGFGGEIAARIADSEAFYYLDAPIKRLGGLDVPIPYNPTLEANVVPTTDAITKAVRDLAQASAPVA